MADDHPTDDAIRTGPDPDHPVRDDEPDAVQVAAFDLDGDGKISLIEGERARLGLVDARLEEIAQDGGVKGAIADALHKVVDKLDNDG